MSQTAIHSTQRPGLGICPQLPWESSSTAGFQPQWSRNVCGEWSCQSCLSFPVLREPWQWWGSREPLGAATLILMGQPKGKIQPCSSAVLGLTKYSMQKCRQTSKTKCRLKEVLKSEVTVFQSQCGIWSLLIRFPISKTPAFSLSSKQLCLCRCERRKVS